MNVAKTVVKFEKGNWWSVWTTYCVEDGAHVLAINEYGNGLGKTKKRRYINFVTRTASANYFHRMQEGKLEKGYRIAARMDDVVVWNDINNLYQNIREAEDKCEVVEGVTELDAFIALYNGDGKAPKVETRFDSKDDLENVTQPESVFAQAAYAGYGIW